MSRPARRILIGVAAAFALLILLMVLVPVLFAGKISDRAKTEVNRTLLAKVDWRSVGLGFFHDFPNLTLTLEDFSILGIGKFQGDTLAAIPRFRVVVDLPSAIRAGLGGSTPIVVRAIELDHPRLALKALDDTTANWNITRPDTTKAQPAEASKPMALSLKRFQLTDAHITFDNQAARLKAAIVGLSQTLSGDFSQQQVAVETRAHADTATVEFAGITYLNHVRVDLSVDAAADMVKKAVTLKQSGLRLNDLTLALAGSAASVGDDLDLDLTFGAPKTDFKSILSLVPAVYAKDFATVKTTGSLALSGNVKGKYGKTAFPAFNLRTKVDNATFRYPDLPLPARDIFLDLGITNPGGSADNTTVNLSRLHVVLGKNPLDATLLLRTPISDPDVDARMQGTVDLADLRRTIKMDSVQQLAGVISANAAVRTRMSYVDKGQYDKVAARGTVDIRDLSVKSQALPHPLGITQASLVLAPEKAQLKSFSGTVGSSDLRASGTLENLLGYVFRDDDLKGSASLASNKFVLDEWQSGEGELKVIPVPPKIDFALDATVSQLLYDKLVMRDAHGKLRIKDQRITLENFSLNTLGGSIAMTGYYETKDTTKPTFDMGLKLQKIDIPTAFAQLTTVKMLAPVAEYAKGSFSTDVQMKGALGENMMPLLQGVTGGGSLLTSKVLIQDFPALQKAAAVTKLSFLNNPTLNPINSGFDISGGRLHVKPFSVALAGTKMDVSGSNGLDQSLDYDLKLQVPQSLIGAGNDALAGLASKAGLNLKSTPTVALGLKVGGSVTSPSVSADLAGAASSVTTATTEAVKEAATEKVTATVDSAKLKAIAEAEKQAKKIRADAKSLAAKVKKEGYLQADSVAAKGGTGLGAVAANAAASQLRKETDSKSATIIREANAKADSLVAQAKR
jgi:hypothetical protein